MLIGYQLLVPQPEEPQPIAQEQTTTSPSASAPTDTLPPQLDSTEVRARYGTFAAAAQGQPQDVVIETSDVRVVFSNKGGVIKEVLLKKYKTYDQKPLYLISEEHNRFRLNLPTQTGSVDLTDLYFTTSAENRTLSEQDSAVITYRMALAGNQFVEQTYVVRGSGYEIDYNLRSGGIGQANQALRFGWTNNLLQLENDLNENRKSADIAYFTDEVSTVGKGSPESSATDKADASVRWFTLKHKYFISGLIAKSQPLENVEMKADVNTADSSVVKTLNVEASIPVAALQQGKANFSFYIGPNDYQVLRKVNAEDFDRNVDLGYAFLKPINKYFLVPLFSFLERFISNYGLLIICLVLIVKTILMPLTYKSYVSMAKMRLLAPELEELKKKNPDDLAKQQQDQMKLYQQVGVSPLSGCVPVLATMPILFSLFFLFPNLIELRQQSFLWAHDLSTYDSFINLPFRIPFYGSHVSLFTVLMTASSIVYAYYNNQMTPTQPGPVNMKFLSYVMPLMFMFVLNSFPAGLTFYYFVSNIVTIGQQLLIRRLVDEDKIKRILDENRLKNAKGEKKQSKFQKYLEKSLQAAEEAKKKQAELEKRPGKKK
ncbi:YidC/Oxa1 family membrane protein insertase [Rhabdobacter roseus]|uniref:Membrane protein insertase YidC n=2 Tax=Rhabdobacter roseus TaxID=1655419 RepID=A0A840TL31_9BACT|nr:YidC/Oxa1 family membrane protein insertase [Rhabdobacter roseus]